MCDFLHGGGGAGCEPASGAAAAAAAAVGPLCFLAELRTGSGHGGLNNRVNIWQWRALGAAEDPLRLKPAGVK